MKNEQTIKSILDWFALAKPNPTNEDISTQVGCHFEEVSEMLDVLHCFRTGQYIADTSQLYKETKGIDIRSFIDKKEMLDALCDQIVTALGVGYMLGFDMQGALTEVNRSNWSKFENGKPIFNEYGKIMKGKDYTEPELSEYLTTK